MNVTRCDMDGVLIVEPEIFEDFRGQYIETYNEALYRGNGIGVKFIQDDISVSSKHVLRGLHGDLETWKLISCLHGKIYEVVVNCDESSSDFGKWRAFILSDTNRLQILVPPKHANGHVVLSDIAIFHYKQSTYYDPGKQFTYRFDEPRFNIWWPVKNPILSQRDEYGKFVK